jgi:hypothetical protein
MRASAGGAEGRRRSCGSAGADLVVLSECAPHRRQPRYHSDLAGTATKPNNFIRVDGVVEVSLSPCVFEKAHRT